MERLVNKYASKLVEQGLCQPGEPIIGGLDDQIFWNRSDPVNQILEEVIGGLNINSILFAKPAEPYFSIINELINHVAEDQALYPQDSETRTFLHSIPITDDFSASTIIAALKERKSIIIKNHGIISYGTVSPEQAFITFSSVCFSTYVKFIADSVMNLKQGLITKEQWPIIKQALAAYADFINQIDLDRLLLKGPFTDREKTIPAIIEAGKLTVDCRMVDSFFGNISYYLQDQIFISQTGSSLDELAGCIDICPVNGSSCNSVTASSEYSAHKQIFMENPVKAILHGHPKFSVIVSLYCDHKDCSFKGQCHKKCPEKRFFRDIPIIPGEVGTGPTGISRTLPPAIKGKRGAIVYGHGIFATGKIDFNEAFSNLVQIERECFKHIECLLLDQAKKFDKK